MNVRYISGCFTSINVFSAHTSAMNGKRWGIDVCSDGIHECQIKIFKHQNSHSTCFLFTFILQHPKLGPDSVLFYIYCHSIHIPVIMLLYILMLFRLMSPEFLYLVVEKRGRVTSDCCGRTIAKFDQSWYGHVPLCMEYRKDFVTPLACSNYGSI